jgi:hypothetical protein
MLRWVIASPSGTRLIALRMIALVCWRLIDMLALYWYPGEKTMSWNSAMVSGL